MKTENSSLNFNNQQFYIGLDVHKKRWVVTVRTNKMELETFSMDPSTEQLKKHMEGKYPGGKYYSVYEAGFCGYRIHRELESFGFYNIVAAPTEVPTSNKEKNQKRDPVDSRKLCRERENGSLEGIYIPSQLHQELRSIVRQRFQLMKKQTRLKNQIKGYLHFYGHKIPDNCEVVHWTKSFIEYLRELNFSYPLGKEQLSIYLDELTEIRKLLVRIIKQIKNYLTENNLQEEIKILTSVPGVGFIVAVTIFTEIMDPGRFAHLDKLASYLGLVPCILSSSDKERRLGLKFHRNKFLRELLIEAAWIAVRKDPALTYSFNNYLRRMSKQEAIIRIAKKLVSRIIYVWTNKKPYQLAIVK